MGTLFGDDRPLQFHQAGAVSAHDGLVAFLHIPKTAGSTLNAVLAREYSSHETSEIMMRGMSLRVPRPRLISSPAISFSKVRRLKSALRPGHSLHLVRGHFDMSLGELLPSDTQFFTLLRDPVERAISHYYHYRRQTADPVHALALRSTLGEWVASCGLVEMDNGQTRRLAGCMGLPCGQVTSQVLDRAKSNLADRFAVVGITERFAESLILLNHAFNWRPCRFASLNVGDERARRNEVKPDTLQAIEECNRFDMDLYEYAAGLFERALRRIDIASELERLQAAPNCERPAAPARIAGTDTETSSMV